MLRWLVLVVAVLLVLGWAATLAISGDSANGEGDGDRDLTMQELGAKLGSTIQSDLRDRQRKRDLDGRITVVRVDCKNEKYPRFTCLAHVAAAGEARRLQPKQPVTITGRHGGGGGYVVKVSWLD